MLTRTEVIAEALEFNDKAPYIYNRICQVADMFGLDRKVAIGKRIAYLQGVGKTDEIERLRSHEMGKPDTFEPITESEKEAANAYPMTKLVEFDRSGKAKAPCHDDKRPSMYYGSRRNVAVCPVCDKKWTPVNWCVEQMGMTYRDAVYFLIGR